MPLHAGPGSAKTDLPDEGTIEITYKLTGDESGPITGTLVVDCADQTAESNEESMSTRSSATKVKAKVTDIEYNSISAPEERMQYGGIEQHCPVGRVIVGRARIAPPHRPPLARTLRPLRTVRHRRRQRWLR